jgi:SAM-dependent methyltransferase
MNDMQTDAVLGLTPIHRSIWHRLRTYSFAKGKISRPIIRKFVAEHATTARTLVLHPEEGLEHFPDRFVISKREWDRPDMPMDVGYEGLSAVADESFDMILCVGLLEHIPTPQPFVDHLHRILRPGGKVLITCSSTFSLHEGPHDYFRFTIFGMRQLLVRWSHIEVLRGSCGPFTTIGILLQRILMQSEIFPPLRPCLELLAHGFPKLDRFVGRQFSTAARTPGSECDSVLPSNLQVVATK